MKALIAVLLAIALSGCVTATYKSDGKSESFSMTSAFKTVEGLDAQRKDGDFSILLNKTGSQTAELLELMKLIQTMTPVK